MSGQCQDFMEGKGDEVLSDHSSSPKTIRGDELSSIVTDDGQSSNGNQSGTRQRHSSLCAPNITRRDKRRRSRSLQMKIVSVIGTNKDMVQKGIKKPKHKNETVPAPFTFEERDKIRQQQKEEKIKQFLEEEKRAWEFHANPIPKSVKCPVSQLKFKSIPPTHPEPFHLHTEERRLHHEEALKAKLKEERRAAEAMRFKARPPVVLTKKPFEPVKPHRVLRDITDICLNSELRSKEREKFDMKLKEKEKLLEERRRKLKEEEERREAKKIARLRRETVHKAQPVPKYSRTTKHEE